MSPADLLRILPRAGALADLYAAHLDTAMQRFNITGPARQAAFIATIGHESSHLRHTIENLSYSAERMMQIWPGRFPTLESTAGYARNPQALAGKVYANRMGHGDEASGDGWKYRGRGLVQLTGKSNYAKCGEAVGHDLVTNPQFVEAPALASLSAAWFWSVHGLNAMADKGDMTAITKRVNGGTTGIVDRLALYEVAKRVLS